MNKGSIDLSFDKTAHQGQLHECLTIQYDECDSHTIDKLIQ